MAAIPLIDVGPQPGTIGGGPGRVFKINTPTIDEGHVRFEFHPGVKKVYFIRRNRVTGQDVAEPFAHDIPDDGAAVTAVQYFLRGYKAAKAELDPARMVSRGA